jgi:hypothetical protein
MGRTQLFWTGGTVMSRGLLFLGVVGLAVAVGCKKEPPAHWKNMPALVDEEQRAVEAIEKFDGGRVERSTVDPGNPIIELHLRGRRADEGLRAASALKTITHVILTHSDVTDEGLKQLIAFKQLQVLELGGCAYITGAGFKELAVLDKLSHIELAQSGVTDEGLKGLAAIPNCTLLDVSDTALTDAGVKEIATLKSLTTLGLGAVKVTDAGVRELAALKKLSELTLTATEVTDTGLRSLAGLTHLTTLRIYNCPGVTDAGVRSFLKDLPTCTVER